MINSRFLAVLQKIHTKLKDCDTLWVITGSLGMVLQGMNTPVHDIDIQTDQKGAYEIERQLSEYVTEQVCYIQSEQIRSHLGKLEIDGIQAEIMGAIQKRNGDGTWEQPVRVEEYRKWVEIKEMQIPVLSLEYEYWAYLKLGRDEKAGAIRFWLQDQNRN